MSCGCCDVDSERGDHGDSLCSGVQRGTPIGRELVERTGERCCRPEEWNRYMAHENVKALLGTLQDPLLPSIIMPWQSNN
jgi:hypothetical protein